MKKLTKKIIILIITITSGGVYAFPPATEPGEVVQLHDGDEYRLIAICNRDNKPALDYNPFPIYRTLMFFRNLKQSSKSVVYELWIRYNVPHRYEAQIYGTNAGARLVIDTPILDETLYLTYTGNNNLGLSCDVYF